MTSHFKQFAKYICVFFGLLFSFVLKGQEADNEFTLDAQLVTRGELRAGGFKADSLDKYRRSQFILGKYRITADYKRSWLEVKLSPQFSGIWGQGGANIIIRPCKPFGITMIRPRNCLAFRWWA